MFDYNKRLREVREILNYLEPKEYKKIPKQVIENIEKNMDYNYVWKYNKTKSLKEQEVSRDTIAILSYINIKYLLNDEQRAFMEQIHEMNGINERTKEEQIDEKVGVESLFQINSKKESNDETNNI